jgi:hypothetical protein
LVSKVALTPPPEGWKEAGRHQRDKEVEHRTPLKEQREAIAPVTSSPMEATRGEVEEWDTVTSKQKLPGNGEDTTPNKYRKGREIW